MSYTGDNLIFLVSQPRAGSTMLQKILGGHPAIHTLAEPWIMLYPCYGLKGRGYTAEYEAGGWARLASRYFVDQIGGRAVEVEALRRMAQVYYDAALAGTGKRLFLDKTPRYYAILGELAELFPDAKFVLLLRNPLGVLCSIVRTWVQGHWERMPAYRHDLLDAPAALAEGIRALGERACVLRYEDLVSRPEALVAGVCRYLDVPFRAEMLEYGGDDPPMRFGDTTGVAKHRTADPSHVERWKEDVRDPRMWRLAWEYLTFLEGMDVALPGYDTASLRDFLKVVRPRAWALLRTRALRKVLGVSAGRRDPG